MESIILNGIGKKLRMNFLNGKVPESHVIEVYKHNRKEADDFSSFGINAKELTYMLKGCHNPLLAAKIKECIKLRDDLSRRSNDQNKISLEKLANFQTNALGIGLRKVISRMKRAARKSKDNNLKMVTLLLETEFANLSAKNHGKALKGIIYERKSLLLDQLSHMLFKSNWKYGYNDNCGKNACYIIYIYLPNGIQLSWHSNDYSVSLTYPFIDCEWDGRVCATMEKLLAYISDEYSSLFQNVA